MIASMKKVWLLVLETERARALKGLRRLGVVHVQALAGKGRNHEELVGRLAEIDRAIGLLSEYKVAPSPVTLGFDETLKAARRTIEASESVHRLHEESAAIAKELDRVASWGDFDPAELRALGERGIGLRLYDLPVQRISSLPADLQYLRLSAPKGRARIAVIGETKDTVAIVPADLVEFALPSASVSVLRARASEIETELVGIASELGGLAANLPSMEKAQRRTKSELDLETLRSGMEADGPIAYISGYVPAKELDALRAAAKAGGWGLMALDPADDELPPTKVENGPIVRIIDPVFQFLGTVPNYREYDISAPFLIFFSLFFAMIFGDAAYGSIMLALGVYAAIRAKAKGGRVPDAIRLLLVIATTTVAWGAATATWFAIPVEKLPSFLRAIAVPYIMSGNPNADTNVKIFCFIVGAVQLALAHLKNIKRDFPNPKFLAQVGSLSLVIGMFCAVLNLVVDPSKFPIPSWALYLIGGGFLLVFVFGNWNGNLLKSIVEGLKGIIPTFLGTVSVFADIVSYIRLWAVGLAGLAISQTVNGMAGGLFKAVIGILFGVILLVVGHSLNLAMSVLSVVVHGIRLNTLEFSSHLGMEWSGYRYDPFRETVTEDSAD